MQRQVEDLSRVSVLVVVEGNEFVEVGLIWMPAVASKMEVRGSVEKRLGAKAHVYVGRKKRKWRTRRNPESSSRKKSTRSGVRLLCGTMVLGSCSVVAGDRVAKISVAITAKGCRRGCEARFQRKSLMRLDELH